MYMFGPWNMTSGLILLLSWPREWDANGTILGPRNGVPVHSGLLLPFLKWAGNNVQPCYKDNAIMIWRQGFTVTDAGSKYNRT